MGARDCIERSMKCAVDRETLMRDMSLSKVLQCTKHLFGTSKIPDADLLLHLRILFNFLNNHAIRLHLLCRKLPAAYIYLVRK